MSNTADDLKKNNNQAGSTAVNSKNNKNGKKKGGKGKASASVKKQDAWKMGASIPNKTPELVAVTKETVAKQESNVAEIYTFPSEETEERKPEIVIPAKTFSKETTEPRKEEPYVMNDKAPEVKIEMTASADSPLKIEAEKDEGVKISFQSEQQSAEKEEKPLVAERFPQATVSRNADASEGRWLGRFLFLSVLVIAGVFGTNFLKGGMRNSGSENVDSFAANKVVPEKVAVVDSAASEPSKAEVKEEVEPEVVVVDSDLAEDAAVVEAEAKLDAAAAENIAKKEEEGKEEADDANPEELTAEQSLLQAFNRSNVYVPNKKEYAAKIAKQTENTTVSPLIVSAVAMAESYLSPTAVSRNGDKKGIMQISADKEAYIQGLQGKKAKAGDLLDPDYNLGLGVWYLDYLNKKYEGNLSKVLYAYSMGEDNLQRVIDGKETAPKFTGRHFANLQRYYNAFVGRGSDRLVLSIPVAELKPAPENEVVEAESVETADIEKVEQPIPGKADVEMAKSAVIVEEPERVPYSDAWVKSIMGMKLKATAQEKAEIVSLIKEQSIIYDMDPAYIASVVMAESAFNPKAVSKRGKRGLFQFEPQWAHVVAATLGMKWQGDDALFDPAYNIELGTAYLQHLSLLFDNDFEKSAIAFSLTPTLVARILAGKKAMPSYVPLYVRNISRYCDKWECKTKVGESYVDRLSKIKLRK